MPALLTPSLAAFIGGIAVGLALAWVRPIVTAWRASVDADIQRVIGE